MRASNSRLSSCIKGARHESNPIKPSQTHKLGLIRQVAAHAHAEWLSTEELLSEPHAALQRVIRRYGLTTTGRRCEAGYRPTCVSLPAA